VVLKVRRRGAYGEGLFCAGVKRGGESRQFRGGKGRERRRGRDAKNCENYFTFLEKGGWGF